MTHSKKLHICIVGSGSELATAGLIIGKHLIPHGYQITLVDVPTLIEPYLVMDSRFFSFCEIVELNWKYIVSEAGANLHLGYWLKDSKNKWFLPFGEYGFVNDDPIFDLALRKSLAINKNYSLENFSLAAKMTETPGKHISSAFLERFGASLKMGICIKEAGYASVLFSIVDKMGIEVVRTDGLDEIIKSAGGSIGEIRLQDGRQIKADFWMDALAADVSGFAKEKENACSLFSRRFDVVVDSPIEIPGKAINIEKYTWGLLRAVPQAGCNFLTAYIRNSSGEASALALLDSLGAKPEMIVKTGGGSFSREAWKGNCLKLGRSAMNPPGILFSAHIWLQFSAMLFVDFFSRDLTDSTVAGEYNKVWSDFCDEFLAYERLFENWASGELCQHSDVVTDNIHLFEKTGRIQSQKSDAVSPQLWISMLMGLGYRPNQNMVTFDGLNQKALLETMSRVRQQVKQVVETIPLK